MSKKDLHRFTIRFNPNDAAQKTASDLLNKRTDKASYLAAALLVYEETNEAAEKDIPTLADIYEELQEIKRLLQPNLTQLPSNPAPSGSSMVSDKNSIPPEIDNAEIDPDGKKLLKDMFNAFSK